MTFPIPYSFTVPGQPVPKGRPRHTKNGHTYTPARTEAAEQSIAAFFRQGVRGYGPPRASTFKLTCVFHVKRDDADIDNLIKAVMDGLQGVAWINDKQVKKLGECEIKIDRTNPRTEVMIEEL